MESLLFLAKKLVSRMLFPLELVLILGAIGWLMCMISKGSRRGRNLVLVALILLAFFSMPICSHLLLLPLEKQAGDYADPASLAGQGIKKLVVLAGGFSEEPMPPAERLGPSTLKRVLEGVRLWRGLEGAELIMSGGNYYEEETAARAMQDMATSIGVPASSMRIEVQSWDTDDQARTMKNLLKDEPFVLVTAASHMPRALWLFHQEGLQPIPAPADFKTKDFRWSHLLFIPGASSMENSERAIYEYLGLIYTWFRSF